MIQSNGQDERCEDEDSVHELKKETKYRFIQIVHMLQIHYCYYTVKNSFLSVIPDGKSDSY